MGFFGNIMSKMKKKKKKSDDEFDDDFDLDEDDDDDMDLGSGGGAGDEGGEAGPVPDEDAAFDEDDEFDEFDDDFDEEGGGKKGGSKKKLILISTAAVVLIAAIGGGSYWFFFTEDQPEEARSPQAVGSAVGMALTQQATSGLTPGGVTGGGKLSASEPGSGGKLSAPGSGGGKLGAPSTGAKLSASDAAAVSGMVTGGMGGYDANNPETPLSTAAVADVGINIPAVLPQKMAALGTPVPADPLAPANDPGLVEQTESGTLPKVSPDGKQPWMSYARPFNGPPDQPVVALVVSGLGMSTTLTQAAIDHLPPEVTLSFSPYASGLNIWVEKARAAGHEVLMELPLESDSFPVDDPGPLSVQRNQSVGDKIGVMSQIMRQASGYIGLHGTFGSALTKDERAMSTVLKEMKTRGLFYLDPRAAQNSVSISLADQLQVPRAISDVTIDVDGTVQRVRAQLETLATIARNQRLSVGVMPVSPNGILAIKQWHDGLQGVSLSPVSNMAGRQQS